MFRLDDKMWKTFKELPIALIEIQIDRQCLSKTVKMVEHPKRIMCAPTEAKQHPPHSTY